MNVKIKLSNCLQLLALGALLIETASTHATVRQLDKIVAIVDNDVIMQSQLDYRVKEVQHTIAKRSGNVLPTTVLIPQILEHLIIENLQLQIGERSGIHISNEELNQTLNTVAQHNNMSIDQFKATLTHDGLSYKNTLDKIKNEMIINRVRQYKVAKYIHVSEQEVQNFLTSDFVKMQLSEELHLANILIPITNSTNAEQFNAAVTKAQAVYAHLKAGADFAQTAVAVSNSDSALSGGDIGWRKAVQLPPPLDRKLSTMKVGEITQPARMPGGFIILKLLEKRNNEALLKNEVHVRHILIKPNNIRTEQHAKELATKIYNRIKNGEDFAFLAKTFSEDPSSSLDGGDLHWIDLKALVLEFQDVILKIPQGVLSKPFRTQYGWHIMEVLDHRTTDNTIKALEQQAMNILRNRKYDIELQNWLHQIRDESYVENKLLNNYQAAQ
ncbi:peptidylprolyl isomerase [Candidatus Pseudomonas adelgestsugas]|uniref:Chaperone SurA n=1 Tax=Candidatus Pseudomonas adelgestsugas TaxID=1302376 RepID=A0ABX5R772_9PSED|nr:Chaperone SurA precursor [Candidatus Pseudomonas adelgestsugas]